MGTGEEKDTKGFNYDMRERKKIIRVALYQAGIFPKCEAHKLKNKVPHTDVDLQ